MVDDYLIPMKRSGILSEEDSLIVFGSCTQILGLSEQIVGSLQDKMLSWSPAVTTIGDVLLLYADFFKIYIPFANNFARGQAFLSKISYNQIADAAVAKGKPNLDSLRIMPIQRIPRYVLLTNELLKATREDHPDHSLLGKALAKIKEVAQLVNARMTASDMEAKVLEIQGSLWTATGSVPELVAPGRVFIKEGAVAKVSTAGVIKRNYYLFCFNDIVVYATTNPLFRNKYHFHKALDYYGAFPADDEAKRLGLTLKYGECAFKVTGSNGYRIFVAGSDAERMDWLRALTDMVTVKEEKRLTWGKAKGQMEDDDEEADVDD